MQIERQSDGTFGSKWSLRFDFGTVESQPDSTVLQWAKHLHHWRYWIRRQTFNREASPRMSWDLVHLFVGTSEERERYASTYRGNLWRSGKNSYFFSSFLFNLFRVLSNFFFLSLFFSSKQIPILRISLALLLLPALRIDHNTNSLSLDMPLSSHSVDHRYLATLFFFFLLPYPTYSISSTILSSRYRSEPLQINR